MHRRNGTARAAACERRGWIIGRRGRLAVAGLAATLGATLVVAAGAQGATVTGMYGALVYLGNQGEANDVRVVEGTGGDLVFEEVGTAPLKALEGPEYGGCTQIDAQRASCPSPVEDVIMALNDGDDRVRLRFRADLVADPPWVIQGQDGADTLDARFTPDPQLPFTPPVTLEGDNQGDTLIGGPANEVLVGGPGADAMTGGDGLDTASYADHTTGVTATLDGVANDGTPVIDGGTTTGADSIGADVENLIGGGGDDVLTGNSRENQLIGGSGRDQLRARGGDDTILADDGIHDRVVCGDGEDTADVDVKDGPPGFPDCETVR